MNARHNNAVPTFSYRYLFSIAYITILLGAFLLLFPSIIGNLFFNNGDGSLNFFVRMLGSTLIGYGIMCRLAVKADSIEAYTIAVWANLSTLIIATVISLTYISTYTGYGWLVIGQHLLFTSGFLYCAWELSVRARQA